MRSALLILLGEHQLQNTLGVGLPCLTDGLITEQVVQKTGVKFRFCLEQVTATRGGPNAGHSTQSCSGPNYNFKPFIDILINDLVCHSHART